MTDVPGLGAHSLRGRPVGCAGTRRRRHEETSAKERHHAADEHRAACARAVRRSWLWLRLPAQHIQQLTAEVKELARRITKAVRRSPPQLLDIIGVGTDSAAALLIAAGDNKAAVIHERLAQEYGFTGNYQRVKLYVQTARPRIAEELGIAVRTLWSHAPPDPA
ncbi:hypothetical protein [Streptomyces sp. NPDC058092]|uniref:hypothetical protein n=1 Tax=Streptomyces sp. NPDC058092 TaxID=3346336 RepID=UPI0036E8B94D